MVATDIERQVIQHEVKINTCHEDRLDIWKQICELRKALNDIRVQIAGIIAVSNIVGAVIYGFINVAMRRFFP